MFSTFKSLTRAETRSFFAMAMLVGIVALSIINLVLLAVAHHAIKEGEPEAWLGMLIEQTRYNSALSGWFALIIGLVVFGADWMRAKVGDKELGFGTAEVPPVVEAAQAVADSAQAQVDAIAEEAIGPSFDHPVSDRPMPPLGSLMLGKVR